MRTQSTIPISRRPRFPARATGPVADARADHEADLRALLTVPQAYHELGPAAVAAEMERRAREALGRLRR